MMVMLANWVPFSEAPLPPTYILNELVSLPSVRLSLIVFKVVEVLRLPATIVRLSAENIVHIPSGSASVGGSQDDGSVF